MVATLRLSNIMQNTKCSLSVLRKTSPPYNTEATSSRTLILLFPPFWTNNNFILFVFLKLVTFFFTVTFANEITETSEIWLQHLFLFIVYLKSKFK